MGEEIRIRARGGCATHRRIGASAGSAKGLVSDSGIDRAGGARTAAEGEHHAAGRERILLLDA